MVKNLNSTDMTGKILDFKTAVLNILNHAESPELGSYQTEVPIDPSVKITDDMVGKTFEFEIKVPCVQFCDNPQCSCINKKVCKEATCFPVKVLEQIFILHS